MPMGTYGAWPLARTVTVVYPWGTYGAWQFVRSVTHTPMGHMDIAMVHGNLLDQSPTCQWGHMVHGNLLERSQLCAHGGHMVHGNLLDQSPTCQWDNEGDFEWELAAFNLTIV